MSPPTNRGVHRLERPGQRLEERPNRAAPPGLEEETPPPPPPYSPGLDESLVVASLPMAAVAVPDHTTTDALTAMAGRHRKNRHRAEPTLPLFSGVSPLCPGKIIHMVTSSRPLAAAMLAARRVHAVALQATAASRGRASVDATRPRTTSAGKTY